MVDRQLLLLLEHNAATGDIRCSRCRNWFAPHLVVILRAAAGPTGRRPLALCSPCWTCWLDRHWPPEDEPLTARSPSATP